MPTRAGPSVDRVAVCGTQSSASGDGARRAGVSVVERRGPFVGAGPIPDRRHGVLVGGRRARGVAEIARRARSENKDRAENSCYKYISDEKNY